MVGLQMDALEEMLDRAEVYTRFLSESINDGAADRSKEEASRSSKRLKKMVEAAENDHVDVARVRVQDKEFKQPALVTGARLREYQLAGVEWLQSLYLNGAHGILADEMGLGKTLQTIAFICHLREMGVVAPFLIVCPLTVAPNWISEWQKFAPSVKTLFYHGSKPERAVKRKQFSRRLDSNFPIVVTSFEIAMRDRVHLAKLEWKYIVVDEGHRIKNFECKLVRELKKIPSSNRLILTGTPLQTKLSELWSLLNFMLPDVFNDLEAFETYFNFDGDEGVAKIALMKEQEGKFVSKLHRILRPFLLRRLKTNVIQSLPPKTEKLIHCGMTELQQKYYKAMVSDTLADVVLHDEKAVGKSFQNKLMQLRKICNHPFLMEEVDEETGDHRVAGTDESIVHAASKMQLLDRLLPRLQAAGHRVLVFSQMTRMLDILEDYLDFRGFQHGRIDGSTSLDDRITQMQEFNDASSQRFVFLLSTRAGGLGVNLVGADTVIFYDSDFNPQNDLQAEDRAHRIGQTKPVHVYRLITIDSVEAGLLARANERRTLEKVVVREGGLSKPDGTDSNLSASELEQILSFKSAVAVNGHEAVCDTDLDHLIIRRDA